MEISQKILNKEYLKSIQYKDESRLVCRCKYNSFAVPRVHFTEDIINIINKSAAKRVLDIGCGNGELLIKLRKSGFLGELFGIDIAGGILRHAEEKNAREKLGIHFEVGAAESLDFPNDYFDVIIAKHVLHYLTKVQTGVDEASRCLKKGGVFLIVLNSEKNKPLLHKCDMFICKKYGLTTSHGQQVVNVENIRLCLIGFSVTKVILRKSKINKPRLFVKYFATFEGNYEPLPTKMVWKTILRDVRIFVKNEIKLKGKFVETCRVGLIVATK